MRVREDRNSDQRRIRVGERRESPLSPRRIWSAAAAASRSRGSAKNWRQNISFLAQHATVYAIDLLNMGQSERVPGLDASLEATADRVAACMDALGLDEADVAGHSHGGAVAMMLAARHPERVRRLILFAPANPFCDLGRQLIGFYQTPVGVWLARQIPWLPQMLKKTALSRMYGDSSARAQRCARRLHRWPACSRHNRPCAEHRSRLVRGYGTAA